MSNHAEQLNTLAEEAQARFTQKHQAREKAIPLSRGTVRLAANAIRATHRGELEEARRLIDEAKELVEQARQLLPDHADLYYSGFVQDAQKEYAEAQTTLAFIADTPLPSPNDLHVEMASYLNGLGEAVGELRRYLLDSLRRDDVSRCEEIMEKMGEVYNVLVTLDFPEALTGGLRRTNDMVRGVLERTRGDLTMAIRQRRLEQRLSRLEGES